MVPDSCDHKPFVGVQMVWDHSCEKLILIVTTPKSNDQLVRHSREKAQRKEQ